MRDYSSESRFARQLDEDILEFIHGDPESRNEGQFEQLALREFERQYHASKPYREYCIRKNVSPQTISHWEEIPAVSSFAFDEVLLASLSYEKTEEISLASRIFDLKNRSERRYWRKWGVERIRAANAVWTKLFLFPDVEKMKILLMAPSPKMAPWMEMAIGLEQIRLNFGTPDSRFLISPLGLDVKALVSGLRQVETTGEPLALIGVAGGLIQILNASEEKGVTFSLPKGSRICDVGGDRVQFGTCSNEEYLTKCKEILGVEKSFCVSALWACENSTNYFDNVLKNHFSGVQRERQKEIPPWTRITAVDTGRFERLPKGEIGLLRFCDLTNRIMGIVVQTDMLGFETDHGFKAIGRWNRELRDIGVDASVGHPGGRLLTGVFTYLMRRNISQLGKIYSRLT